MKICILTHSLHTNYGGLIQAFALQKVLKDMGHDVVTTNESAKKPIGLGRRILYFGYHVIKRYLLGNKAYNPFNYLFTKYSKDKYVQAKLSVNTSRFVNNHILNIDFFEGKIAPTKSMLSQFDAFVVGSDQVWRAAYVYTPAYFLDFTKDINIKRIAYAASFGTDNINEYSTDDIKKCREGALLFDAISVREDSGIELCKNNFGVDAMHLLDPTMLLSRTDYEEIIESEDMLIKKNILMCYVLDKSEEKKRIINYISSRLNLNVLEVMPEEKIGKATKDYSKCIFPSVSKWVAGFRDAEFVVTDSFHGTVFSIIFNKPFISIANQGRGVDRFISLLKMFGLEQRLINSISELSDELILGEIDFESINSIMRNKQAQSKLFLIKNLN